MLTLTALKKASKQIHGYRMAEIHELDSRCRGTASEKDLQNDNRPSTTRQWDDRLMMFVYPSNQ